MMKTSASPTRAIPITALPMSSSGRRPARSSRRIATSVIPTLTMPTATEARIAAADESTPVYWTIVGA